MLIADSFQIHDFERTPQGFLVLDNSRLARVGTQKYLASELSPAFDELPGSQIVTVYRPPEEVFSKEALDSLAGKPITVQHQGFLDSKTIKGPQVGHVGDAISQDGDFVKARVYVTHEDGVKAVDSGIQQLSVGYNFNIDKKPGTTPDGEAFDAVFRDIRANHVALVLRGRGGSSCRVHDEANRLIGTTLDCECGGRGKMAKTINFNGVAIAVEDQAFDAFEAVGKKHDEALQAKDAELATKDAKVSELEGKLAASDAKVEDLTGKLEAAELQSKPEALDAAVKTRSKLIEDAHLLAPDVDCSTLGNQEIKTSALKAIDVDLEGKGDAYVDAAFDTRVEMAREKKPESIRAAAQLTVAQKAKANDAPAGRVAYMERVQNAVHGGKS